MNTWELIRDLFVGAATVCGGVLGTGILNWLKKIHEQLKSLNDTQIRHDEKLLQHHEWLRDHEVRIGNMEKN